MKPSAAIGSCILVLSVSALASEPDHIGSSKIEGVVHAVTLHGIKYIIVPEVFVFEAGLNSRDQDAIAAGLPVAAAAEIPAVGLPIADRNAADQGAAGVVPVISVQERLSSNDGFGSTMGLLGIALMDFMVDWLTVEFDLPPTEILPAVTLVPVSHLIAMRYGHQPMSPVTAHADVAAVYHDRTRTILLPEGWTGRTPGELSLLVHELVHHVQNVARIEYDCPEAREKPAYAAQERWLILSGTDLATEFGLDPMTLLVRTHCFH